MPHITRRTAIGPGFAIAAAGHAGAQDARWNPSRPINLIVPWAAGGATDQVTRVVAAELESPLGQIARYWPTVLRSGIIGVTTGLMPRVREDTGA